MQIEKNKYPNLGKNIKRLRKEAGLTQQELGERLGVGKAAVSKWENGTVENIKSRILYMLCDELNAPLHELLEGREEYFFADNKRLALIRLFVSDFQRFLNANLDSPPQKLSDIELMRVLADFLIDWRKKHPAPPEQSEQNAPK